MKFILAIVLSAFLDIVPSGQSFLRPLAERDSVLIADQLEYGFRLDSVREGTSFALQDFSQLSGDTLAVVRDWKIDTLKNRRGLLDIEGSIVIAPFEEGHYELPGIALRRLSVQGEVDTLVFEGASMDVRTMPVDTATFVPHDIKGQIACPVTFSEILPYVLGGLLAALLVALVVYLVIRRRGRKSAGTSREDDPPHIVALRRLDKFRSNSWWAPEKQKAFYSGITDTLKDYIGSRFGIDAPEMTTAELFAALKSNPDITPELYGQTMELFERADFVKFAKHAATDEENAAALPLAVRFVTSTYRTEPEEGAKKDVL